MSRNARLAVLLAIASFAIALLLANAGLSGYSHRLHPLALRGAAGLSGATWFNLAAFVLPGGLLAIAGLEMRDALADRGWRARVGMVLVQLSALTYASQGLLPLDLQDADSTASRLHALAWMLWWIAFVPGTLLLAAAARRGAGFALACLLAAVLVPLIALFAPIGPWVGLAQRLVFALWFGWWLLAAWAIPRASTSGRGSSSSAGK